VCLVRLTDLHVFVTDGNALQRHIFEANVRDYQGSTEVNQEIRGSLANAGKEDFWWLNNGVTVLASKAVLTRRSWRSLSVAPTTLDRAVFTSENG